MKKELEKALGTSIKSMNLFDLALTHKSAVNENPKLKKHNERMEFLGDAVLELIVTEYLYKKFPEEAEGNLTSIRASLVKGENLAKIAKRLDIGSFLKLSKGEEQLGGREKSSLLANTIEALIGAIYLDSGILAAKKFIEEKILSSLEEIIESGAHIDAKSYFQQYAQAEYKKTPKYIEIDEVGPDHDKIFTVAVNLGKEQFGIGKGQSKQAAQQAAAVDALKRLKISKNK